VNALTESSLRAARPCTIHVRRIACSAPAPGLNRLYARLEQPAILGGGDLESPHHRFSCWAAEPLEIVEIPAYNPCPLASLEAALARYRLEPGQPPFLPGNLFCGGWIGYLSYDLGPVAIEPMPISTQDDLGMPLVRLGFYDHCIVCDHQQRTTYLIALQIPGDEVPAAQKLDRLNHRLSQAAREPTPPCCPGAMGAGIPPETCSNMTRDQYLYAIHRIKQYIIDGETYQINFSQRFARPFTGNPLDLFAWQNTYNPSPYAAYLAWPGWSLVSASPEMFLDVHAGRVSTRPIKGTRPRVLPQDTHQAAAAAANRSHRQALEQSEKERAELDMIIDLERNDLARICRPGTRTVVQPRFIEAYATVYHAMATISGRLRDTVTFCDILKATFPGGSITGAPKIRSMQIIDETEPTARGAYTGSIGFISINGSACLNIAIRTIIIANDIAYVQTGGGIVADSVPEAEYRETLTKARALWAGIAAVGTKRRTWKTKPGSK